MPRPRRIQVAGSASYIHQEALDGIDLFKTEDDRAAYVRLLKEYQVKYQFNLFSYALTSRKVHLLIEPTGEVSTSQIMRDLTSRYSKYYNGCYEHTGSLFHGRFKTVLIEKGSAVEEVKAYLSGLAAAVNNSAVSHTTAQAVFAGESLQEALKAPAYGSSEFIEMVKRSVKTSPAVEPVMKSVATTTGSTAVKAASVKFSMGFSGFAVSLALTVAVGTGLWFVYSVPQKPLEPKKMESHVVQIATGAQKTAETLPVAAAKAEKKLVIVLDGTEWNVQLIPTETVNTQDRKVEFDHLKFVSSRMASEKLATNGYNAAHYTVSQTAEGVIVWETIQRNPSGEMVSWRGEWDGSKMKGVLSRQLTDGKAQVFNFIGTMNEAQAGAAGAPKIL